MSTCKTICMISSYPTHTHNPMISISQSHNAPLQIRNTWKVASPKCPKPLNKNPIREKVKKTSSNPNPRTKTFFFMIKNKRVTYNRIRSIFLLAHNPWNTSVQTNSHLCSPFRISFSRSTNFPFNRSILVLNLSNSVEKNKPN